MLDPKIQSPDQFAPFDSRTIGERNGSARPAQPDLQNAAWIISKLVDNVTGPGDRIEQAHRHSPQFGRSFGECTTQRGYNPPSEAAVSVVMAQRRKEPMELTDRDGQPIAPHCFSPTVQPAPAPQLQPGAASIAPNRASRAGANAAHCCDAATQRHVMSKKPTGLVWTASHEPYRGHTDRDERPHGCCRLQLWRLRTRDREGQQETVPVRTSYTTCRSDRPAPHGSA